MKRMGPKKAATGECREGVMHGYERSPIDSYANPGDGCIEGFAGEVGDVVLTAIEWRRVIALLWNDHHWGEEDVIKLLNDGVLPAFSAGTGGGELPGEPGLFSKAPTLTHTFSRFPTSSA